MKKHLVYALGAICFALAATAACGQQPVTPVDPDKPGKLPPAVQTDPTKRATVIPTVYDNAEVVSAEQTEAGDVQSWQAEVFTKNGGNNDMPTKNALIKSPWHTLTVNDVAVPVYTARCGKGSHSFAWVDVADHKEDFELEVKLTMHREYAVCVVLPESRNVIPVKEGKTFTSVLKDYGSYTYTFSTKEQFTATDPTMTPLTVMVAEDQPLEVPAGYDVKRIAPGYHTDSELEFTDPEMYYVFESGVHEISSINVPENSVLFLERGAYLKCTDRQDENGTWNAQTAIHMQDCVSPKVTGRGLLDMGEVLGGDNKHKHVVNASRCKDPVVEGLTIINANTWTLCFYNNEGGRMERNLLLGYRTYSDGLMMSECRNTVGRYNFVRTGDDAIEFKGTGWGGQTTGENCLYEYNDCWTDKGSGYCLTWESACDMTNMTFRNNAVGFAQPTWSAGNNALDCRLGTDLETRWGDVVFRDIEIYHVISPNVMITQMSGPGAILDNILFENITIHSAELGVRAYMMSVEGRGTITGIKLRNINFCGRTLTAEDAEDESVIAFSGSVARSELTIQ